MNMIEKVARAILVGAADTSAYDDIAHDDTALKLARAAILAMREPTELMIVAGDDVEPSDIFASEKASRLRYQAMIDAALKEDAT